jgi:23S rRNA pseudouridine1911/1915/1917 synthase
MSSKLIINKNNLGMRIDKFLKEEVFFNDEKITRGEIIRNIKEGNITLNERIIKPSYALRENDEVEINIPEKHKEVVPNRNVKFSVIYQDKNIIAINKPAGLQIHPSMKNEIDTLVNGLIAKFPEMKNVGDNPENRPGIIHRLDKETSGVMVVARNQRASLELKKKFKNREVAKKYLAIVRGEMKKGESGIIDKAIARAASYKKQVIAGRKTKTIIRPAMTEYSVLDSSRGYSLVEVMPKTGRMHQIRVHLSSIGHPIAGDKKYGSMSKVADMSVGRHMLHAENLQFELFSKNYSFGAKIPDDFLRILGILDLKSIKS